MLTALIRLAALGVVAVIVWNFLKPGSSGPSVIKGLGTDISYYYHFLMGAA